LLGDPLVRSERVAIVGGGVIGLCAAVYCAERGFRTTLIERHGPRRDGCSFGNAGMVCPSHFIPLAAPGMVALGLKWMWNAKSPFYIKPRADWDLARWGYWFWRSATARHVAAAAPLLRDLGLGSRVEFESLEKRLRLGFGLERKGLFMLCQTEHALEEESKVAEQARALGIPAEILDARQTAEREPGARMQIAGSVRFPKDCHLIPDQFLAALEARATELGVEWQWGTEIVGWRTDAGSVVSARTTSGEIRADAFVLCGGSWSPRLGNELSLKLPMQAGKGYSLTLRNPRQLPNTCAILAEARVAVTPMGGALRFGGTMEIAGLNERVNPLRVRGIVESAIRYYPDFRAEDFEGIEPWRGLRPVTPDGLPYLGRSGRWPNLVVATGHAMLGLSLAPITGKIVAQLLAGEKPEADLSLLAPERFG
jgi:D-amino-acid dehydrogenase